MTPPAHLAPTRSLTPVVLAIALAFALHGVGELVGPYPARVMIDCGIAIIAAVSLTIVNGFTGQFSIGHAAFMAIGGYTAAMISYYALLWHMEPADIRGITPSLFGPAQWLLAGTAIIGGLASAGAGYLVGLPSLRLRGDYLAIVTLGFGEIIRVLLQQTPAQMTSRAELHDRGLLAAIIPPAANGATGFRDLPPVSNILWTYLFVAACVLIAYRLKVSSYGRALLSIREDEIAAEAMGIPVARLKVRAFILAAFFAGIAGAIYAHETGANLSPRDAGFADSFKIVMIVVLGGMGSISGSVLAAILVTVLNELLRQSGEYRMIIFALTLILVMIFRPQGLFGLREIWDLFRPGKTLHPPSPPMDD